MTINPLLTSSFSAFKPGMGAAINTAVKPARWMAGIPTVPGITPAGIFGKPQYRDEFPYRIAYTARLDEFEDRIKADLQRLSDERPPTDEHPNGVPLVLLCWCNVGKGEWCHRRMFAEWMLARDVVVDEARPPLLASQRAPRSSGKPAYYDAKHDERYFTRPEPGGALEPLF
jgi:hypothetical protein